MTTIEDLTAQIVAGLPAIGTAPTDTPSAPAPPNLPADFWGERPELARIRRAAHCRARSADAVLGVVLARIATLTPPSITLPAVVASEATFDLAVALIGHSGTGKSSGAKVGGELVPIDDDAVAVLPLGSGEGIIEAYFTLEDEIGDDGKTRRKKRQTRRAVLAMLDEGQALAEMGGRRGSTLLPTIRSAWTGDRLGQANASEETKRHIAPGSYRFALIAGFQTELAATLMDDAAGGTPQRFAFFAAEDPTIPDDAPDWPGPIRWSPPVHQAGPLDLDPTVAAEIRGRALARSRGEVIVDPLDAHRDLGRLKVSGLLALLAGRTNIDADDWRLAGDIYDASDRVRTGIVNAARWRAQQAEQGSIRTHVRRAAAIDDDVATRSLDAMARAIGRHVHRGRCAEGCGRRCVSRSTSGKHREHASIDDAIEEARRRGWVITDGDEIKVGEERP